jgi:hypothetical protein
MTTWRKPPSFARHQPLVPLKHRTCSDDNYLFPSPRTIATKIIIPLTRRWRRRPLLFTDQRPIETLRRRLQQPAWNATRGTAPANAVPPLDRPLREHLRNNGSRYRLAISPFPKATRPACLPARNVAAGDAGGPRESSNKLVSAMLSSQIDES